MSCKCNEQSVEETNGLVSSTTACCVVSFVLCCTCNSILAYLHSSGLFQSSASLTKSSSYNSLDSHSVLSLNARSERDRLKMTDDMLT